MGKGGGLAMAHGEFFQCKELPGRGRGLVSSTRVRAGEIVLKDYASLLYVAATGAQRFCGACLRICRGPDVPECDGSGVLRFCSSECSASFPEDLHAALWQLKEAEFDSEKENQARFLLAAYHLALVSPKEFEKVLLLEGEGKVDDEGASELHPFVQKAVRLWPWKSDQELSAKLTADLLIKESRNAFGLMAPCEKPGERTVRGYGLYTTAAFINHECLPNCCRFDYVEKPGDSNTDIYIRAMHDIELETEITISYFPINWPYEVRQERLENEYGFKCVCERCSTEQNWSDAEGEEGNSGEEDEEEEEELQNVTAENSSLENNVEALSLKTSKLATKQEDEEEGEEEEAEEAEEDDDDEDEDFQHAMFFVKYLCPLEECGGTMAPIPPSSDSKQQQKSNDDDDEGDLFLTMECNMCDHVRTGDEFRKDLEENSILE